MYEVATHRYGRRLITRDGPAQGLLKWPQHCWTRITSRPIGLKKAKALADAQETHATVQPWMTAEVVYSNGKVPLVPSGWYHPDAQMVGKKCGECNGTGKLERLDGDWGKTPEVVVTCWACHGSGVTK